MSVRGSDATSSERAAHARGGDVHLLAIDDALVFAAKPPGMPSDRTRDPHRPSLVAAVEALLAAEHGGGGATGRVWIGHRLDRDTSGVVAFARSTAAAAALHDAFARREAQKRYLALVAGHPGARTWTADNHLAERGRLQAVVRAGGKRAITHFEIIGRCDAFSLVLASPVTGRTHQIRVQLGDAGLPIVGDVDYGGPSTVHDVPVSRSMLHAAQVSVLGRCVDAPLWHDMEALLRYLGLPAPGALGETL